MIRLARENETRLIANMWDICFDDPKHFIEWNFSRNYSPENTMIFEENGALCANMQLMPYKISLCGQTLPVSYISGVATLPEYRMRGCYRALQTAAFSLMRERKIPIAVLVPFNFEFYEKQGFKAYCDKTVYTLPYRADLPTDGAYAAQISDGTIEELDKIYTRCATRLNGYIVRSKKDWRLILEDVLLNSGGGCEITEGGYALYQTDKATKNTEIFEMMCEDDTAAERLLGSIKNTESFKITAPQNVALDKICTEQRTDRFAMLRIVDAEAALKLVAQDFRGSVRIKITDENITENNASFEISKDAVRRCNDAELTLNIKQLAELVSGYKSPEEILSAADAERLCGLFEKCENFINLCL